MDVQRCKECVNFRCLLLDSYCWILFLIPCYTPLAWYALNQLLSDFAYQVPVNPLVYVSAGMVVLVIAFASVFYQSMKAAVVNPSDTLRNE